MTAPKKKKLEKKSAPAPEEAAMNQKFFCSRCGLAYGRRNGHFPVVNNPMYRGGGYLHVCNDCVEIMFRDYTYRLGSDRAAMRHMCMILDLYWNERLYDSVERGYGTKSRVRTYIGKTNVTKYLDKTYDDTLFEMSDSDEVQVGAITQAAAVQDADSERGGDMSGLMDEITEQDVPEEVKAFWGPGYTGEMYLSLQDRWNYYVSKYLPDQAIDLGTEVLLKQICNLEIDTNRDRAAGKPVDKYVAQINTLLGSLSLKPVQKKEEAADAGYDQTPFGVWIKRWEDDRPVPEIDEELKDVNRLRKVSDVWFRGHLAKMLGIKNSLSRAYDEEIEKLRVEMPQYDDEDDETFLADIFGSSGDTT